MHGFKHVQGPVPMSAMQQSDSNVGERWMHDLRNVVNVMGSSVTLSRRLIEKGRPEEACVVLQESEKALAKCFELLNQGQPGERGGAMHAGGHVENGAANHLNS